jgi:hypothetical protein
MKRFLATVLIICFALSGCQSPLKTGSNHSNGRYGYKVINLESEFVTFWDRAKGKPFDEQVKLWDEIIEKPHQDFYDSLVWAKRHRKNWQERRREKLENYFRIYEQKSNAIESNFKSFEVVLEKQIANYKKKFPDAEFSLDIYAAPTAGSFNGKAGDIATKPGETVLAFGMDMIVERNDDANVLYSHELFHVYHVALLDLNEEKSKRAKLTLPLWLEGLATYVSGEFNPKASDGTILLDHNLVKTKKDVAWLSEQFIKIADNKAWDEKDPGKYLTWFAMGKDTPRSDMPVRTGYLLGLEVTRVLAKKYSLYEMVHWDLDAVHSKVLEGLKGLQ